MELNVKRFYLPEDLVETCPYCGQEVYFTNYLSYPETGVNKINFACQSGQEMSDKELDEGKGCIDGEFTVEYSIELEVKRIGNLKEVV